MNPRRGEVIAVLLALAGCAAEPPPAQESELSTVAEPLSALDGRKLGWRQLAVSEKSDFAALAHLEEGYQGPYEDATGRYIEVLTTERGAQRLEEHGFLPREARTAKGAGTQNALAGPCAVPDPSTSAYLWSVKDLHTELLGMHNGGSIITTQFGTSHTGAFPLLAVRFGPTNTKIRVPPTLYVVATHHAREWISTGVAMELARQLRQAVLAPSSDPVLSAALQTTAIVVVPVVNPDGYEYTRTTDRSWRGNRDVAACAGFGVDINRNYTTSWKEAAEAITSYCSDRYCGPGAASESETKAMETLLRGDAFGQGLQVPAAAISYHAYGDLLVYADGYKQSTDSAGPRCGFEYGKSGCTNPDFQLLRRLYGDSHSPYQSPPLMVDTSVSPAAPFVRDSSRTALYAVSGEFNLQAQYTDTGRRLLSVVPELPNNLYAFAIECQPGFDGIIQEAAKRQLDVLRRMAPQLTALVSTDYNVAYAPKQLGRYASGIMTREYSVKRDPGDARATFVKPIWRQVSTGSLTANINGTTVSYQRGRTAAQYESFFLDQDTPKWDWSCLPCQITSTIPQDKGDKDQAVNCTSCVKLCDGNRLPASGWALGAGNRGPANQPDCWWSPTATNGTLTFPTSVPPANAKACHFSFALQWNSAPSGWRLTVERQNAGGTWEWLWEDPYDTPRYPGKIFDRLVSLAFEGNDQLPGKVGAFRFRLTGSGTVPADLKVFDPVVYCKTGSLP